MLSPSPASGAAEADALLARIETRGRRWPRSDVAGRQGAGGWWGWSEAKRALEWLFWSGSSTTTTRRASFERVYDLPERVLPRAVLAADADARMTPTAPSSASRPRRSASRPCSDLRDYFRLRRGRQGRASPSWSRRGELIPVAVEGWQQARLSAPRRARRPRKAPAPRPAVALRSAVWERQRTERLFGFRYRIEIYTPAHKREHGYYVLPFLLGDALVARVDLKADRKAASCASSAPMSSPGRRPIPRNGCSGSSPDGLVARPVQHRRRTDRRPSRPDGGFQHRGPPARHTSRKPRAAPD